MWNVKKIQLSGYFINSLILYYKIVLIHFGILDFIKYNEYYVVSFQGWNAILPWNSYVNLWKIMYSKSTNVR